MEIVQPGPTDFIQLLDTPSSFFSAANKAVTVNAGATALIFTASSSSGITTQTPTGTINGSNKTFNCTGLVSVAIADGLVDSSALITGATDSQIVYSVPPQSSVYAF